MTYLMGILVLAYSYMPFNTFIQVTVKAILKLVNCE